MLAVPLLSGGSVLQRVNPLAVVSLIRLGVQITLELVVRIVVVVAAGHVKEARLQPLGDFFEFGKFALEGTRQGRVAGGVDVAALDVDRQRDLEVGAVVFVDGHVFLGLDVDLEG